MLHWQESLITSIQPKVLQHWLFGCQDAVLRVTSEGRVTCSNSDSQQLLLGHHWPQRNAIQHNTVLFS